MSSRSNDGSNVSSGRAANTSFLCSAAACPVMAKLLPQSIEFTALLSSNDAPAAAQTKILQELRAEQQIRLQEMENSPSSDPAVLHERYHTKRLAEDVLNVLHPLRKIPPELLSEIFSHVVGEWEVGPGTHSDDFVPELTMMVAPWKLAAVSRLWQSVSLAIPRLWTTVVVNWLVDDPSTAPSFFKLHLKRSGSQPLNVNLVVCGVYQKDPVFDIVVQTCPRWKKLGLDLRLATFPGDAATLDEKKSSLTSLESLYLNTYFEANKFAPTHLFESAPKLRFVAGVDSSLKSYVLPWKQIKGYQEMDGGDEEAEWEERVPKMQSLRTFKGTFFAWEPYPSVPVEWKHLTQLCLRVFSDPCTITTGFHLFLDNLSLPQLTHLTLHTDNTSPSCFQRFTTVQHLCLSNMFGDEGCLFEQEAIISLVTSLQNLKSLCVSRNKLDTNVNRKTDTFLDTFLETPYLTSLDALWVEPADSQAKIWGKLREARPDTAVHFNAPIERYFQSYGFVFNAEFPENYPSLDL